MGEALRFGDERDKIVTGPAEPFGGKEGCLLPQHGRVEAKPCLVLNAFHWWAASSVSAKMALQVIGFQPPVFKQKAIPSLTKQLSFASIMKVQRAESRVLLSFIPPGRSQLHCSHNRTNPRETGHVYMCNYGT